MATAQDPQQRTPANAELDAFNAAFHELGLEWHWDAATMADLAAIEDDQARVLAYIERYHGHLLKVYDPEFLSALVVETKRRQRGTVASVSHAAPQQVFQL